MIDPTNVNLDQLPKKFCDGAIGAYNKEVFTLILTSGNSLDAFATTPQILKSISLWMSAQVQNYEQQFGTIIMTPPEIQSPIQAADLGK
ncbi:MAG: hypothetical protein WC030_01455 [Candidatus Paceibacterota bacterium]